MIGHRDKSNLSRWARHVRDILHVGRRENSGKWQAAMMSEIYVNITFSNKGSNIYQSSGLTAKMACLVIHKELGKIDEKNLQQQDTRQISHTICKFHILATSRPTKVHSLCALYAVLQKIC